jgi:hypothetical protein
VAAAVLFGQSCPRRYDWTDSTSRYGLALRCTEREGGEKRKCV